MISDISFHSFAAATIASQWLELILLDVKGRLEGNALSLISLGDLVDGAYSYLFFIM